MTEDRAAVNFCPTVPTPMRGTVGQRLTPWDSSGTVSGTPSLKLLAHKVLARDSQRDTERDSGRDTVPATPSGVGQRLTSADGVPSGVPPQPRHAPKVEKPLVMRDGRRRWSLPPAGDPNARVDELVSRVRTAGVVLVADGRTLHATAPRGWQPADGLAALARNSAAIVRALHRASDDRLASGQHMGAAMTDPNGDVIEVPAGEPVRV